MRPNESPFLILYAPKITKLPLDKEITIQRGSHNDKIILKIDATRINEEEVQIHVIEKVNPNLNDIDDDDDFLAAVNFLRNKKTNLATNKTIMVSDSTFDKVHGKLEYWFVVPFKTIRQLTELVFILEDNVK